jgi:hypothetical protein
VLHTGVLITPPQLPQYFNSGSLAHSFIHSDQGNPTFGTTYSFYPLSSPRPGNNTFGAIRAHPIFFFPLEISPGLR